MVPGAVGDTVVDVGVPEAAGTFGGSPLEVFDVEVFDVEVVDVEVVDVEVVDVDVDTGVVVSLGAVGPEAGTGGVAQGGVEDELEALASDPVVSGASVHAAGAALEKNPIERSAVLAGSTR